MGQMIYWIGAILALWCIYDLFTVKRLALPWKLLLGVLIFFSSWAGLLLYYFFLRELLR